MLHSVYNVLMNVKMIVEIVQSKSFPFLHTQSLLFQNINCRCNEPISDVEKIEAKNLILCSHGSHTQDACLRGYTSQRDLQAHIKRRHESTRLDSPHQLLPSSSSTASSSGLLMDPQQQQQQQQQGGGGGGTAVSLPLTIAPSQAPPPLLAFAPPPPPPPPPPPIFDHRFRQGNHHLPPQSYVPPQAQYRAGPPYPPPRPFY